MTGDHTNMSNHPEYKSSIGQFSTTIILYDPSGDIQPGIREGIAQQTDIMPTVLSLVGYNKPYVAFGCDLLNTPAADTWAINYLDGIYQYCKGGYVLQFDGQQTLGLYRLDDRLMRNNLVVSGNHEVLREAKRQSQMEREAKAIIQQYMDRMIDNRLVP
jgi:hypothetical protein